MNLRSCFLTMPDQHPPDVMVLPVATSHHYTHPRQVSAPLAQSL